MTLNFKSSPNFIWLKNTDPEHLIPNLEMGETNPAEPPPNPPILAGSVHSPERKSVTLIPRHSHFQSFAKD
jgi:hypothetical protein